MTSGGFLASLFRRPPPAPPPETLAGTLYRLTTTQGGWVSVQPGNPSLTVAAQLDQAYAVIALHPAAAPHLCLLTAPDGRVISVHANPLRSVLLSARLLPTNRRGLVRLRCPLSARRFLTAAVPPDLRWDGEGNTMHAVFALQPMEQADLPTGVRTLLGEALRVVQEGLRAAPLLARLAEGTLRPALAEPLIRAMRQEELDDLARRVSTSKQDLALLSAAMPDDPWVAATMPALFAWAATRAPRPAITESPPEDEMRLLGQQGSKALTAGAALNALARRQTLPQRNLCLLATARNEGPYLLDWIAYHQSIGFEHIFLYSNDNTDGSDALLEKLAQHGVISWIRNARGTHLGVQEKAYGHALNLVPEILDYRWAGIFDLDEYIGFNTSLFTGMADFIALQEAQSVDAVALCWLMFGAGPGQAWSPESTLTRMVKRQPAPDKHVKTLFKPRLFWYAQPHFPTPALETQIVYRTAEAGLHHHPGVQGRIAAFSEAPRADFAWVNHYFARTADEALWKFARGRADWLDQPRRGEFLFLIADAVMGLAAPGGAIEDRRILDCAAGQGAALARLRALPGVAASADAITAGFGQTLRALRRDFLASGPGPDEPLVVTQFRNMLRELGE